MSLDPETHGAFYGRRVGKRLRPLQLAQMESALPRFLLSLEDINDPCTLFPERPEALWLEIGFGGGEHLLAHATRERNTGFIGVEPFLNGMARMAGELGATDLTNVRLFNQDAALLIDRLPDACLAGTDLFYPDPWPKRRHWKRRFVRSDNLDRLARVIRPGGTLRVASDVPHYVGWTLAEIRAHGGFEWKAESAADWTTPYPHWPGTRYEAKALREGRIPSYLTFMRR